jgi:DNA-binding MurR/RpiR family transcriptional regulator
VAKLSQITLYYSPNTPAFARSHVVILSVIQALAFGVYSRDVDQHEHRIKASWPKQLSPLVASLPRAQASF